MPQPRYDIILVGGGLQSGLMALALRHHRPATRIALIESEDRLGGNHTWCFQASDVPAAASPWLQPLITYEWPGYDVAFPNLRRSIEARYYGISSSRLHDVVASSVSGHTESLLLLGRRARRVEAHEVRLEDGLTLAGSLVVDARGLQSAPDSQDSFGAGYQKFLGLELELSKSHGLERPVLMDATVPQIDGFRFMYVLPLSDRRLLLEDTYFSDSADLQRDVIRGRILDDATARGFLVAGVRREEHGVLPMPWSMRFTMPESSPLVAGYRGGWFHPATGYSFPVAIRLAEYVAGRGPHQALGSGLNRLARKHASQLRYALLLNHMLFRWYPPAARWHVFERFYRFPQDVIARFYALRMSSYDRVRILTGRPPRGLSLRHRFGRGI